MACRLLITQGKITRHMGDGVEDCAGSRLARGEVSVINRSLDLEHSSEVCSSFPLSRFMEKQPGGHWSFRTQELRHNLGQDVIFSLPEAWALLLSVRPGLLSSATSRGLLIIAGKIRSLRNIQRENCAFQSQDLKLSLFIVVWTYALKLLHTDNNSNKKYSM